MPEASLSAGTIHYEDSGGDGPPLVLLHGLAMDGRVWRDVVAQLAPGLRCIAPTLPFGSHREPMRPDADLSLRGFGRLIAEFGESLDAGPVTLCFSDWSGAQPMAADGLLDGVGALVLVSCETEGNYPPGLAGRAAAMSARLPGGLLLMRQMLLRSWTRRLPFVYGQMSRRGVPDDLMRDWLEPLRNGAIRRDVRKYVGDVRQGRRDMAAGTRSLRRFERPVLVVWDRDGRMMPNAHGRRLAAGFPNGRLVEIDDSYTLIQIDQPARLAGAIREFVAEAARPSAAADQPRP